MFSVGDVVWFTQSGYQQSDVECPDCLGQCVLTVVLGDGSQVSIACACCERGYLGSTGKVVVHQWDCKVESGTVTGMDIDGDNVQYKVGRFHAEGSYTVQPDVVFATKDEAETEAAKVLAAHQEEETRRFNHVKDNAGRHRTWAWNASYHRREAKEARRRLEYHEGRLAVAKAKSKETK